MKKRYIKTFKQVYFDKKEQCQKEHIYHVGIVKDTEDYMYRIMNFDELSIWKTYRFKTFKEAQHFIDNHPHNINKNRGE